MISEIFVVVLLTSRWIVGMSALDSRDFRFSDSLDRYYIESCPPGRLLGDWTDESLAPKPL